MDWRISEPAHLLRAMRLSLLEGGHFLSSRIAPLGPILRERNLNYVYQACWGMVAPPAWTTTPSPGSSTGSSATMQDGDLYFPRRGARVPRHAAALPRGEPRPRGVLIDHPMVNVPKVVDRIVQYQHRRAECSHYIGDNLRRPEHPSTIGTLSTTCFGHLMIALDMREQALAAGQWVRQWVEQNRGPMGEGNSIRK